jgi:hypothetical protein
MQIIRMAGLSSLLILTFGMRLAAQEESYELKDLFCDFSQCNDRNPTTNVLSNGNRKPYLIQIDVCEGTIRAFEGNGELIPKGVKMVGVRECDVFSAERNSGLGRQILNKCPVRSRCRLEARIEGDGMPFIVHVERLRQ